MIGQVYGSGSTVTETIPDVPYDVAQSSDPEERDFWQKVDEFKRRADEAWALYQRLRAKGRAAESNAELKQEYDDVLNEAEVITQKVGIVERAVNTVREGVGSTIRDWFGLEGYQHAARQLGQVGFVQFAALAAVAAAIAWLGTWITKAKITDRKLTAVERLAAEGHSLSQAGEIIAERGDPGALSVFASKAGTGIALAGLAAVVLYFFFEKDRGF